MKTEDAGRSSQYVYTVPSVYGKTPAEVEAIRARSWQPWLAAVLGLESPKHASF